jgi:serine/threonine protein kinase/Tfp pilus assembly protein PilF
MSTMTSKLCPPVEDLVRFLNQQGDLATHTEIALHVDSCQLCQQTLAELTQGHAYGLSVLGRVAGAEDSREIAASSEDGDGPETPADPAGETADLAPTDSDRTEDTPSHTDDDRDPALLEGAPAISSYEILEVIGEGGMGVVYKARQRGLNRLVALKMIRGGEQAHPERFARFRIEAEAVARLKHPNIVQIYEIGEVGGLPFLSLEFLEGGTLEDRLAGTPQPGRQAALLLAMLARAVQVAHDAGIIHRDLKPSNVLFAADDTAKITDFGLAKRLESDSRQTESGQIVGTPSYMAPEQATGRTRDVGPAADVYALGAILYDMLTGRPRFKGETPIETVRQVVEDDVVPPSRLVPRLARDLETICLHCLNKEPSKRYGSARALAEDLDNFVAGRPIKARRTPFWERGVKLARRRPVAATLLALGLVTVLGSSGAWSVHSSRESLRRARLRTNATGFLFHIQDLLTQQRWSDAEPILTRIQVQTSGERGFDDLSRRIDELLAQARRGRAAQETMSRDQKQLQTFRERRQEALVRDNRYTGLDLPHDRETFKTSAQSALAVFADPRAVGGWEMARLPESLVPGERDEVNEGCYELLLLLAEDEPAPDRGLGLLDQAARLRPATRVLHLRRADWLERKGDAAGARRERQIAEALPLDSALDHYLFAKERFKRGDWSAARRHFGEALSRQHGHFWAHCLSAICSMQLGQPIQAKADLDVCLETEPDLAWLYELRGFAKYRMAELAQFATENLQVTGAMLRAEIELQYSAAASDYARALALLDKRPNDELRYALLVNRGSLWLRRGEWDKAVADLEAAIALDARQWQAFQNLALVYQQQRKLDRAIDQLTRAIKLRPASAALYRLRAGVNLGRKARSPAERSSALADLEQAIRLEPAGGALLALDHTNRARLLREAAREEEALAACDAALAIDAGYLEAHRQRIEVLRKLKRHQDVVRSCDALVARGKPSAELYELRGLAKEKLKDYEGAIEDQTLAIAVNPGTARPRIQRGALYLATDTPRAALRDFREGVRLDPSNADARLGRGLAFATLGQHREATADAEEALTLDEATASRLYNAARIHALAAIAAAVEARRQGPRAASLTTRYEDQAIRLLGEWFKRLPPAERSSAVGELLQDQAMSTLRRRLTATDLAGAVSASAVPASQPRP